MHLLASPAAMQKRKDGTEMRLKIELSEKERKELDAATDEEAAEKMIAILLEALSNVPKDTKKEKLN